MKFHEINAVWINEWISGSVLAICWQSIKNFAVFSWLIKSKEPLRYSKLNRATWISILIWLISLSDNLLRFAFFRKPLIKSFQKSFSLKFSSEGSYWSFVWWRGCFLSNFQNSQFIGWFESQKQTGQIISLT